MATGAPGRSSLRAGEDDMTRGKAHKGALRHARPVRSTRRLDRQFSRTPNPIFQDRIVVGHVLTRL